MDAQGFLEVSAALPRPSRFSKGGKGGDEPRSSKVMAKIAKDLYTSTDPMRQNLIDRGNRFLEGDLDVTQSPLYGALMQGSDAGYGQSEEILQSQLGGQATQGISDLAIDRALRSTQTKGALAEEELARAMGLGIDTITPVMSGLAGSAQMQASAAQAKAAQSRAKGQSVGKIAGTVIGAYFGGPAGAAAGGSAGSALGGSLGGGAA